MMYINGMVKFIQSFKNIIDNSRIDDSDLVAIEVYMVFAEGAIFAIAGIYYSFFSIKQKVMFGYGCFVVTLFLWIQGLLMRYFYMVAMEHAKDAEKDE